MDNLSIMANTSYADVLNKLLKSTPKGGTKFGEGGTVSSVLRANLSEDNLTDSGEMFVKIINGLDPGHIKK